MKKFLLKVLNILKYVLFAILCIILEVDSVFRYVAEDIFHIPADIVALLLIPIAILMIFLIIRKSNKNKIISKSNKKAVCGKTRKKRADNEDSSASPPNKSIE